MSGGFRLREGLGRAAFAAGCVGGSCLVALGAGCAFVFPTDNLTGGVDAESDDAADAPAAPDAVSVSAPTDGHAETTVDDTGDAAVVDSTVLDASPPGEGVVDATVEAAPDSGPVNACDAGGARVFVTAGVFSGDLGGVAGADKLCDSAATAAGLGGSWNAWLSDSTTPAAQHIYAVTGGAGYVLVNGTMIAANFGDLTSSSKALLHPIDTTETGTAIMSGFEVWTGTDLGGLLPPGYCASSGQGDWTSSDPEAGTPFVGLTTETGPKWSNVYEQFCDRTTERLYCFERCM